MTQELIGFCAAPWVESVLYCGGEVLTCCRSGQLMGNWKEEGLKKIWHGPTYERFRKAIRDGQFPDPTCRNCHANGTARTLRSELAGPFQVYRDRIYGQLGRSIFEIDALDTLFDQTMADSRTHRILEAFFSSLNSLKSSLKQNSGFQQTIDKLRTIGRIADAFLHGNPAPPVLAPFRQVRLLSRCNARCIHCVGRYTGEIQFGPELDPSDIPIAFEHPEDIIDFFMNGSEFLFYKNWKTIAGFLNRHGVKLSISTNGILLTPANITYLIDHEVIRNLNLSIDGATAKTVESIRSLVRFDHLMRSLDYLFQYASDKGYAFGLSVSMVLMKNNYQEFPDLVRLIHKIRGTRCLPAVNVYCQALEGFNFRGYKTFVHQHHHSLIPRHRLKAVFEQTLKASQETAIPVNVFYTHQLDDFIQKGCPFPPMIIPTPHPKRISPRSPVLEPTQGFFSLDPAEVMFGIDPGLNGDVEADSDAGLTVQLVTDPEDHGLEVHLMAVVTKSTDDVTEHSANCPVFTATGYDRQGQLIWSQVQGPVNRLILLQSIPFFDTITCVPRIAFHLGREIFSILKPHKSLDVFVGYSPKFMMFQFKGGAFRWCGE